MKHLLLSALILAGCDQASNLDLSPEFSSHKAATKKGSIPSAKGFAMVSTPGFPEGSSLPGVVRQEPWGEMVATLPSGTLVWVDASKTASDPKSHQAKKWWHVRFYQEGAPISGWMHSGILKPPVWKEPEPSAPPIDSDSLE